MSNVSTYECFNWILQQYSSTNKELLHTRPAVGKRMDFAGDLTCPLIIALKEGITRAVKAHIKKSGEYPHCYLPSGKSDFGWFRELYRAKSIDHFPDLLAAETIDNQFSALFMQHYTAKGYFESCHTLPIPPYFIEQGIPDPAGEFTVLAVNPFVIVVDHARLGTTPVPAGITDLLSPRYRNTIIIGGINGTINANILLAIYKEYGEEGVINLGLNIKDTWMHTHMGKRIGTGYAGGSGIYLLPWAIAKLCARRPSVSLIFPEEGAPVQLIYLLAKKKRSQVADEIAQFLTDLPFAELLSQNLFPPLHPHAKQRLPEGATLRWLGWEYIRSHDIAALRQKAAELLTKTLEQKNTPCSVLIK